MIKVIVSGAAGRMGRRITALVQEAEDIELVGAFEAKGHPALGRDVGEVAGLGTIGISIVDGIDNLLDKADVLIDFSHHLASIEHLKKAVEHERACVIGSTGFSDEEMALIRELTAKTRCVLAPNMSVGVNLVFKVLDDVARILGDDYDVEIVEAHHRLKKDAPSGTAMKMAQILASALGRDLSKVGVFGRQGLIGERSDEEIGIQTLRGGDIVGEHTVLFIGKGERIEVIHRAHSRDNFAQGALRAVRWIVNQQNGLYDMQDVLGLR